ncbi:SunI/YnzG family protein [Salimicrobium flavidum]|uniref:Sublancin immunity protein SunI-like PH domain-containing protein n=1 Tax=Salimicrobium flavidum TaxID=570947 RepID=A0A1N7KRU2_9BACI|nr:hypothetical protein [Salimicrobium flavidum]SIS64309.1 hypothetical protein SAMN05421687_1173 [Salimicrobium flavidum]
MGIKVKEKNGSIIISWMFSKVEIPKNEIKEINSDDTYGGEEQKALRIGHPSATNERILIKTSKQDYLLFTNEPSTQNKIERMISRRLS